MMSKTECHTVFILFLTFFFFLQIQGKIYFDFFLFDPMDENVFASEMSFINLMVMAGKERFLIHPIFEIFLKLKW